MPERGHHPTLGVAAPAAHCACPHTARLALRGCPRPPAAALWRTARMRAGPGRPACSAPSHHVCLRLMLAVVSRRSHRAPSGAAAQLLVPLTSALRACGLALLASFSRLRARPRQKFPSRHLEGRRSAEPRQSQPMRWPHPCYRAHLVVEWEDSVMPNRPLLRWYKGGSSI